MTDSQPDRPDVIGPSRGGSADAADPRARRAAARAARQAAADQRRSDRAVARSLAMSKRQAAVSRADGEPQDPDPAPAVVETPSGELSEEPQHPDDAKELRGHARAVAKTRRAEGREKLRAAKARARAEAAAFKEAHRAEVRAAKQAAISAKSAARGAPRDRIVEAPREPKKSLAERLRRDPSSRGGAPKVSAGRRAMSIVAGLLGLVGMTCSVILAVGALLVALRADGSAFYDTITDMCDVLVGPLRDVVSFSGTNATMKEALVAWGAGSIIYLVVGLLAQSFLRPAAED